MRQKELYEKSQLLKAGQVVEIAGDWFRAFKVPEGFRGWACEICDLDCLCKGDVALICSELDRVFENRYYLKLAHR